MVSLLSPRAELTVMSVPGLPPETPQADTADARSVRWPTAAEYHEAIQAPALNLTDAELRGCKVALNAQGTPLLFSGNFADVYRLEDPQKGSAWAVKCFTRSVAGLRERYHAISAHLAQSRLPFMVEFEYQPAGMRIGSNHFPIVKMRWVDGISLNRFVEQSLDQPGKLDDLQTLWIRLAARLRAARIAHADLQHGNVLLVPRGDHGQLALRLVDYDGMYVPALAGTKSGEVGHPSFQHPQRLRDEIFGEGVDQFSHLAITCALRCLRVAGAELWRRYDTGDNLLFTARDFASPRDSALFRELWELDDLEAKSLVGRLVTAATRPLAETPSLDSLIQHGRFRSLSDDEQDAAQQVLGVAGGANSIRPEPSTQAPEEETRTEEENPFAETWTTRFLRVGDAFVAAGVSCASFARSTFSLGKRGLHAVARLCLALTSRVIPPLSSGVRRSWRALATVANFYWRHRREWWQSFLDLLESSESSAQRQFEIRLTPDQEYVTAKPYDGGWDVDLGSECVACAQAAEADVVEEREVVDVSVPFWVQPLSLVIALGMGFFTKVYWLIPILLALGLVVGYLFRRTKQIRLRFRRCVRHASELRLPTLRIFGDLLVVGVGCKEVRQQFVAQNRRRRTSKDELEQP